MSECITICDAVNAVGTWLYDWQTLLVGTAAFAGALWTVKRIREQINQAASHRRDDIHRRHVSCRVALPLALSKLDSLIRQVADEIADRLDTIAELGPDGEMNMEALEEGWMRSYEVPADVVRIYREFVETLDPDTQSAEIAHVAQLFAYLQIFISRVNSFSFGQILSNRALLRLYVDAAIVGLLNDKLYHYGRFLDSGSFSIVGTKTSNEVWDLVIAKAHNLAFHRKAPDLALIGPLAKIVEADKANGRSPWLEPME